MSGDALYTDPKLAAYKGGQQPVPPQYWLWPLYGAGLGNLGQNDQPICVPTQDCGPDELLVRHDAVGLCFSDTKVIKAGETHPRLSGRDMKAEPVVLGHEVALTVVQVGDNLTDQFKSGDRFIVQADIQYKGVGLAYGYALQGGLSQYNVVGDEVLRGDDGCYLIPVKQETGYAQAALTEPWACVTASYDVVYRIGWMPGGAVLIAAGPAALGDYAMSTPPYSGGQSPARVITLGVTGSLLEVLRSRATAGEFELLEMSADAEIGDVRAASGAGGYDDIVFLGASETSYEQLEPLANSGCALNIVGSQGFRGPAKVDVGRLHYDNISLIGTAETDISLAYAPIRTELAEGGKAAFLGAAGPMGQMHVQRALQSERGPSLVVATDLVEERLGVIGVKYRQLIDEHAGTTEVILRTPAQGESGADFNKALLSATDGAGYDDIVVLAPSAGVVAGAVSMLAPSGVMNIFAGLPRGTKSTIDLSIVPDKGVRFTGTSGSAIGDLRGMLGAAEAGQLNPNLSVAAVSGMCEVKKGLDGVMHQAFPGKVVIYPQVLDFPATSLPDLKTVLPSVYAKLGPNESWTVEAEAEFLKELLP